MMIAKLTELWSLAMTLKMSAKSSTDLTTPAKRPSGLVASSDKPVSMTSREISLAADSSVSKKKKYSDGNKIFSEPMQEH